MRRNSLQAIAHCGPSLALIAAVGACSGFEPSAREQAFAGTYLLTTVDDVVVRREPRELPGCNREHPLGTLELATFPGVNMLPMFFLRAETTPPLTSSGQWHERGGRIVFRAMKAAPEAYTMPEHLAPLGDPSAVVLRSGGRRYRFLRADTTLPKGTLRIRITDEHGQGVAMAGVSAITEAGLQIGAGTEQRARTELELHGAAGDWPLTLTYHSGLELAPGDSARRCVSVPVGGSASVSFTLRRR